MRIKEFLWRLAYLAIAGENLVDFFPDDNQNDIENMTSNRT
ncbi:hypothetical protein OAO41_00845 [Euryarchaeota archaeon]|nr:hypothetical protein [Euryarchaeota archaeon]|tara:strand:+ start:5422 stop:5544 length:123 start_codon:yes stop_codon:yes gene_type:complete